jgi:hypothetical protein
MHKMLTVRSFYTIYNQTIFNYVLRIYNEKLVEYDIPPGQKIPILNSMKNKKCSLCISNGSDDWSESFDIIEILEELSPGKDKAYLVHGLSYTFLSKQVDKDVDICYNLCLLAPVIMRNCLPFNIDVRLPSSKQDFYIIKGEEAYFLTYDLIDPIEFKLKIDGFEYTNVKIDPANTSNEIKTKILDFEGTNLTLFIKIERERAGFELILYSKVCIINYTGLNMEFFTISKKIKKRVAGQKVVGKPCLMTSKASKLVISYRGANSKNLKTKQIGYKDDFKIKKRDEETKISSIYEFVYSTSLNLVTTSASSSELFSKNIKIFPKYVIVNHMSTPIKYSQYQNPDSHRILESNCREILFWSNDMLPQLISIKSYDYSENIEMEDSKTKWNWTLGIPVKNVGIVCAQARSNSNHYRYRLLRIEKRLIESTIYVIIDKESMQHPTFMIEN